MKLINNMLGQIQTVAIAEAMVLGAKAGLDAKKIYEVVSASTGNSVQFQNRVPRILARNFTPGGTLDISFKDQELETAFAKRLGVPLFLANVSQQVYQMGRAGVTLIPNAVVERTREQVYRPRMEQEYRDWPALLRMLERRGVDFRS